MIKKEEQIDSTAVKKQKIRERYKGISEEELDFIPAAPAEDIEKSDSFKRVAVYARVSTDDPNQTSSYELQKNHYTDMVNRHPNWILVDIYADEGISGTSLQHRDSFLRMINDCKNGKIDLIVTKSVSRFARNIVDCISYVRDLKKLNPPIGVMFETEHIYTLNGNSEMSLSFIATLAQEESHTKSEIMNASIEMRFKRGIFLTPPLLGYDNDEDGNLVINEDEAMTVKLIFFMYLYGYSCQEIADQLTSLKRKTKKGNTFWSSGTVLQQLQNERHCGDVLSRKTFTPSYLDHKSKKNRQDRNQYRQRDHHEAIISRDDFIAVQHMLRNSRKREKGIMPQLTVMDAGALSGFVSVNPRWSGFKAEDYIEASASIANAGGTSIQYEANSGDFDLRGFELAKSQFFEVGRKTAVTFSIQKITFSVDAVRKLDGHYIEMLVHPKLGMIAVRSCPKNARNMLQWARFNADHSVPKAICGKAFLPALYELFGWNPDHKYRINGFKKQKDDECLLLFDIKDTEALIPQEEFKEENIEIVGTRNHVYGFPAAWNDSFGDNYYETTQPPNLIAFSNTEEWQSSSIGIPAGTSQFANVTKPPELNDAINSLIKTMKEDVNIGQSDNH